VRPEISNPLAVIDIGSNSVRLVVFDGLRRHPQVLFNEKVLCGLGRGLGKTGRMDDESIERALSTLRRFRFLLDAMDFDVAPVAVATSAVREAENGPDFVELVRLEAGIDIQVIDGPREAELSALGVISGIPLADGVVGDLGGGSLELVEVRGGDVHRRETVPVGPVRLQAVFDDDIEALSAHVKSQLKSIDWLKSCRGRNFYLVGGAWRAISRVCIAQENLPLQILHGFTLPGDRARDLARLISRQHAEGLAGIELVPGRRKDTLPIAAAVLHQSIGRLRPESVVTSSLGLREGLIYERLTAEQRSEDPFLSAARELADLTDRFPDHSDRLMRWIDPLFAADESAEDRRLRYAVCMLSDISWRGHPDYRAERAALEILYGRFVGIDHRGRAYVALALNQLYGAAIETPEARLCQALLDEDSIHGARLIGAALRLAQRVSAGTSSILDHFTLSREDGLIALDVEEGYEPLMNEVVERRLKALASLAGEDSDIYLGATPA